jgi:hypothetical protein
VVERRELVVTRSQCAAALIVMVGVAACGGTSANPGVANIGTGTQSTTTSADTQPVGTGKRDGFAEALAYSRCMRAHGVTNFPDPQQSAGGGISLSVHAGAGGINPSSPTFAAAQSKCKTLLPNHGTPPALSPQQRAQALKFSRCVRAHGVPNFPDPQFGGGGIRIQGGPGLDKNSAQLQAAFRACHSILPGIGG